jgi:UDP-2,3-diacylglucosamine pyrophosphatase LpxH
MKFAIISDTHFGDDSCMLVTSQNSAVVKGQKYDEFKDATGQGNDYLILAGDILDFSIASYEKAYQYAQFFFQKIREDGIAREIIYLAGNHDTDIWHIIQHQRAVTNRLQKGYLPESFEHSVAGLLDDRTGSPQRGFILDKVTERREPNKPKYAGMFFDKITTPETFFNFAYPNLYIATDNETVLVTHGQYLEPYWAILGEIGMKIAYDDLKVGEVDIEEMVEMNFPLNQLACTGIGQAGVLTKVVRMVEADTKNGDLSRIKKYLNRVGKEIDDMTDYGWLKEIIEDYIIKKAKEEILDSIGGIEKTRYSEEFVYKEEVKERFRRFYTSSLLEIGDINSRTALNIPAPWRIIFGHTHQPIAWNDPNPPKLDTVSSASPRRLTLHNTGGWLKEGDRFCGAEIFTYESSKGFSSISIR